MAERFIHYVEGSTHKAIPSQKTLSFHRQTREDLGRILVEELREAGLGDAQLDESGLCICDAAGQYRKDGAGALFLRPHGYRSGLQRTRRQPHRRTSSLLTVESDIVLPDDPSQSDPRQRTSAYLMTCKGDDLITAGGGTLLGADDKAGIAVIMDMVQFLSIAS